jgi:hypothetical protein
MSKLQKLLDLNEEIIDKLDDYTEEYNNILGTTPPSITDLFVSLNLFAFSFFPDDRDLPNLTILEEKAKHSFENLVYDEKTSYLFNSNKTEIMKNIKNIKTIIHEGMKEREKISKLFVFYVTELKKGVKDGLHSHKNSSIKMDKLLYLNEEIINKVDNYNDNNIVVTDTDINNLFSYLHSVALSFFKYDRSLHELSILDERAKPEFENLARITKAEIMKDIKNINKLINEGMKYSGRVSKMLLAYLDELEKYFKEETYNPQYIPSLAFFADKNIATEQLNIISEIEKEAVKNATLHFKKSKNSKSSKHSKSRGGNNNYSRKHKK